eukprot:COSAG06_NODE_22273_length_729_cov_0.657143_1_plen_77_part_01
MATAATDTDVEAVENPVAAEAGESAAVNNASGHARAHRRDPSGTLASCCAGEPGCNQRQRMYSREDHATRAGREGDM